MNFAEKPFLKNDDAHIFGQGQEKIKVGTIKKESRESISGTDFQPRENVSSRPKKAGDGQNFLSISIGMKIRQPCDPIGVAC